MKTTIYFIRHGDVYNPKDIFYARLPRFRLSEKGKKQVSQTALFLSKFPIEHIYASPLLRAKQTAKIVQGKLKKPTMHTSRQILEVKTSQQGVSYEALRKIGFNFYDTPIKQKGDETIKDISSRMIHFTKAIHKKHRGKYLAVVSHGDPLMILEATIKKRPLVFSSIRDVRSRYIDNGEVFKVEINDRVVEIERAFQPKSI